MARVDRHLLRSYIGPGAEVKSMNNLGFSEFSSIYINRPDEFKFAVVETADKQFIVWNLLNALSPDNGLTVLPPSEARSFPTLEAAEMYAIVTHDNEDPSDTDG